jgi:hypothetical protein
MGQVRWAATLSLLVAFVPCESWACGGGVVTTSTGNVGMDAERVFLKYQNGVTDVVVQISVPQTGAQYGALLPLEAKPELDSKPVPASAFSVLDANTSPHIEMADESSGGHGGCACFPVVTAGDDSKGGVVQSAQIAEPVAIGPVTATVLAAEDAGAVNDWLSQNGFALPANGASLIDEYSGSGRFFVAIRRNESATSIGPSSIGVHYTVAGDARALPLRFARLGADLKQAFTVFVAAETKIAPGSDFKALTLMDLDAGKLREGAYGSAVENAVHGAGDRAFVIESVTPSSAVLAEGIYDLLPSGWFVTRLTTIVNAEPTEDVRFDTAFDGDAPSQRTVLASPPARNGSYAAMAFAGLGLFRRRRGQTRRDAGERRAAPFRDMK